MSQMHARNMFKFVLQDKWRITCKIKKFHVFFNLRQNYMPESYLDNGNISSSLWFTNLPNRKRRALSLINKKRAKAVSGPIRSGPLVIDCKRKELNHYRGMHYKKFAIIPLASKGWLHRKSAGDYFKILPISDHPAFLIKSSEGEVPTFENIGINDVLIKQLKMMNIHQPTNIQAKAIPKILPGENVLMVAETGCGKTLAYLTPMVQNILKWKHEFPSSCNSPFGVILLPTRELAVQVGTIAKKLCSGLDLNCLVMIGGHSKELVLDPVVEPVDIMVCSLGVLMKHMAHKLYSMERCKMLVVDEADTLLDDSFNQSLIMFFKKSQFKFGEPNMKEFYPNIVQLCLISATMPYSMNSILESVVPMDILRTVSTNYLHKVQPHIPQLFMRLGKSQKPEMLLKILKKNLLEKLPTMIFSNKTATSNWLNLFLNENKIESIRINGKMRADERIEQYQQFQNGVVDIISCTDITSRGLDTTRVKHVINYDFPKYMAVYIHRCGRTGRLLHHDGCSITNFISAANEVALVQEIEKAARTENQLSRVNSNISRIIKRRILNYDSSLNLVY